MADIVDRKTRSRMMSGIRAANTNPELVIRSALHRAGFRFSLQGRSLPGRPDIVFRKHNAVTFVHGCFWHGHKCALFKWPESRADFWRKKINSNRRRDKKVVGALHRAGWRVAIVWECSIKGRQRRTTMQIAATFSTWLLNSRKRDLEIAGRNGLSRSGRIAQDHEVTRGRSRTL